MDMIETKGSWSSTSSSCGDGFRSSSSLPRPNYSSHAVQEALEHIASSDLSELVSEAFRSKGVITVGHGNKEGADPNIRGLKERTSLGWTTSENVSNVTEWLLNAGVDPNVTNDLRMTSLEVATCELSSECFGSFPDDFSYPKDY